MQNKHIDSYFSKNETLKEIIREKEKKGEKPRVKKTKVKIIKKLLTYFMFSIKMLWCE